MKQLSVFICYLLLFVVFTDLSKSTNLQTNVKFHSQEGKKTAKAGDEGLTLWNGWVKYFKMPTGLRINKPTNFFVNPTYFKQKVENKNLNAVDVNGVEQNITSKYNFYCKLFKDSINILSEKALHYGKTVDILNVDMIKPLDPSEPLKGSIKDLGSFSEGSCLSIMVLYPKDRAYKKDYIPVSTEADQGEEESWIICFENDKQKEIFFTSIVTYKIQKQKEQGIELVLRESNMKKLQPEQTPKFERYSGSDANPSIDGYLMLIQDWIGCTLKCGGGETVQQWRCIPPKAGGRPCMGELIRKKKCNTQPCPGVNMAKNEEDTSKPEEEKPVVFKPIFRSMPFIDRPQQDVPCVIRENDILYEKFDKKSGFNVKVPGRILLNNRTISIFEDSSYDHSAFHGEISQTNMLRDDNDKCCFFLDHLNVRQKVCALTDCGTEEDPKFRSSWESSYSLFKQKCYYKMDHEKVAEKIKEERSKSPETSNTLASMNIEESEVSQREKIISDKLNSNEQVLLEDKVFKTQKTALKAITRELNLEERLKREELMKGKEETKILVKKMNKEKAKKEKLEEAIDAQNTNNEVEREKEETKKSSNKLIMDTEEMINKKRKALKRKILEIRKMTERRKRLIENKISLIRGKMTEEVVEASKAGDMEKCKVGKDAEQTVKDKYCDSNLKLDYQKNTDCKNPENFCYICCETEFGPVHYSERSTCYDMCDGANKKKKEEGLEPRGDWVWSKSSQEE